MARQNKQSGGRKHRSRDGDLRKDDSSPSSTDSDSDVDDLFKNIRLKQHRPIVYWWYFPSVYNVDKIFTPTFVTPIAPYVQLWIPKVWVPI